MKKLLSFTLVAVMLLSTLVLSSCDLLDQAKDFVHGVLGIEDDVRTTINEEEWKSAFDVTNYDLHVSSEGRHISIVVSDTVAYVDYLGMELYVDITKGTIIGESNGIYYGITAVNMIFGDADMSLGEIGYAFVPDAEVFDDLVYDEAAKVYTFKNETIEMEVAFHDGKLAYLVATAVGYDMKVEIKNVGTTKVELPEYVDLSDGKIEPNNASASAVTTVTKEQYEAAFGIPNYTLSINAVVTQQISKYTETATERTLNYMGSDTSSNYEVLIDGVWHDIYEKYNSEIRDYEYVASPATSQEPDNALVELFGYFSYEDLVYNTENRYYSVEFEGDKYYLYFENGNLTQIVMFSEMDSSVGIEFMIDISDVGTTVVDLPEYTIVENTGTEIPPTYQGMVTEDQWDAQVNATINYTVDSAVRRTIISTGEFVGEYSTHFESAENGSYEFGHNSPYRAYLDDGVYNIDYNEETGTYEARKTSFTTEDFTICGQTLGVKYEYSNFTYNEYQGRYEGVMVVNDVEYQIFVYFDENGTLVKIGMVAYMYEYDMLLEGDVVITSLGTTVVTLPEYVIIE